jgi:hypothetical protein
VLPACLDEPGFMLLNIELTIVPARHHFTNECCDRSIRPLTCPWRVICSAILVQGAADGSR